MIEIVVADDHKILLEGIVSLFNLVDDIEVVGTASNGVEVLELLKTKKVDLLLMDINMPVLNGIKTTKEVLRTFPYVKVIGLSMYDQHSYFKRMMKSGASGYLLKTDSSEEIMTAIKEVYLGKRYISSQMLRHFSSMDYLVNDSKTELSRRELEIVQLISEGHTDQRIADKLNISRHTTNTHRKNILQKMDVKNAAELVRKALEQGLI